MSASMSRRTLAKGAAWAAPVVAATAAIPAYAASDCPTTADIEAAFAAQSAKIEDYAGCSSATNPNFTIYYGGSGGSNGYLNSAQYGIINENDCSIDMTTYPLAFRIDVKNLTGPDTNTSGADFLQRSLTITNAYGYIAPITDPTLERVGIVNREYFIKNGTDDEGRTVYSAYWNLSRAKSVDPNENMNIQWSWAGGLTSQGRLTNAVRFVPLGLAHPEWSEITSKTEEECPEAYAYYQSRAIQWYENGEGCIPNINWRVGTDINTTDPYKYDSYTQTPIACNTGLWSEVTGDFTPAHDGIW